MTNSWFWELRQNKLTKQRPIQTSKERTSSTELKIKLSLDENIKDFGQGRRCCHKLITAKCKQHNQQMPTNKVKTTKDKLVIKLSNWVEFFNGIIQQFKSWPSRGKQLNTVNPWRLQNKETILKIHYVPRYRCTKLHWSGGAEHHGM